MNKGQEQFQAYILERVQEGKIEEAKTLLADSFKKQDEGNFAASDALNLIPRIITLLKPDMVEEVQIVMKQFAANMDYK